MSTKIISNTPYSLKIYWQKLIQNHYLITTLTKRELKVKYSRTLIGIGWVLLQPLVVVLIYTVFFKNLIKLDTENIPYPQFVLSGLVLWYLFTGIIGKCSYALLESGDLIQKVSFPRIIVLFSRSIPVAIECLGLLVITLITLPFSDQQISLYTLSTLFYFLEVVIFAFSIGLIASIVVLKYRDLAHAIPFVINFGIWLTPVFYSASIIPDSYKNIYRFTNPLALAMEGIRGGLFLHQGISIASWLSFLTGLLLLFISFSVFVKFEKRIVENL
jgi:lipopolysaccharide transport system permease protein